MGNIIITQAANGFTVTVNIAAKPAKDAKQPPLPRVPGSNLHVFSTFKEVQTFLAKLDL